MPGRLTAKVRRSFSEGRQQTIIALETYKVGKPEMRMQHPP
jgi:hypothetical protein